jgi:GNAT superfamily N-acetyltransferase
VSESFRHATPDDAEKIAYLHADSWRRHYRGAYSDEFLDGDVVANRLSVWTSRLAAPGNYATVLAENGEGLAGFVHVVFDEDARWGSLLDNLHVTSSRRRTGIGGALMTRAAGAVLQRAVSKAMYLLVLQQNTAAQRFYEAMGGTTVESGHVAPPGGVPSRLNGSPGNFRIAWTDVTGLGSRL